MEAEVPVAASKATSVAAYLDELTPPRRAQLARVREVVRQHLPPGFVETMAFGMIAWEVPLARYPRTYNGKALMRAGLAAQKRYNALYLSCTAQDPAAEALLREAAKRAGKPLDMGKGCVRFVEPDELPLDGIAALMARLSVEAFVAAHERGRQAGGR